MNCQVQRRPGFTLAHLVKENPPTVCQVNHKGRSFSTAKFGNESSGDVEKWHGFSWSLSLKTSALIGCTVQRCTKYPWTFVHGGDKAYTACFPTSNPRSIWKHVSAALTSFESENGKMNGCCCTCLKIAAWLALIRPLAALTLAVLLAAVWAQTVA